MEWRIGKKKEMSDLEVILGLQNRDRKTEEWFYRSAKRYFEEHFNEVFFDKDKRQEIFQSAFLKLWTEIDNRRIRIGKNQVCRQQQSGEVLPMKCSLTTFLMAFARTEYRELVRNTKEEYYDELYECDVDWSELTVSSIDRDEDDEEQKNRVVDECIGGLSPHCVEILTQFYFKGLSLDEIMTQRGEKNASKNGLKTAKNKCMNTLKERITIGFKKYNLII
ncbi:MAG: sigma-70 family RNA polymerase sigma factor [Bacteroidales bacterium]|nr:sigma-70 family RNA polymerase sigma factor [Bacteroidales bacterium]